jgi:4,5-DOPA dioxygenase extradiol
MPLNETLNNSTLTDKMPVLFVGHGNPMNAITDNSYSQSWKTIGEQLPVPNAILT